MTDGPTKMFGYDERMSRASNRQRPLQGEHIYRLRLDAGLTQAELAKLIGENQQNVAFWERSEKPPRSDVLPKMAKVLGVSVEDLLRPQEAPRRRGGPAGKLQLLFEEASALPRSQQERVVQLLQTFIHGLG